MSQKYRLLEAGDDIIQTGDEKFVGRGMSCEWWERVDAYYIGNHFKCDTIIRRPISEFKDVEPVEAWEVAAKDWFPIGIINLLKRDGYGVNIRNFWNEAQRQAREGK